MPIRIRTLAVFVIKSGSAAGSGFEVSCRLHADGKKKVLLDEIFKPLTRELLDYVRGHRRAGVAVGHASPGTPARHSGAVIVVEPIVQAHVVRSLFRVFAKMHI